MKGPPIFVGCQRSPQDPRNVIGTRLTANVLGESNKLRNGELTSFDTTGHWPFILILNSLDYNVRKILHCCESNLDIVKPFWHDGSAILKVELGFEGAHMIGRFVWMGKVIQEQARLKKCVLKNLCRRLANRGILGQMPWIS